MNKIREKEFIIDMNNEQVTTLKINLNEPNIFIGPAAGIPVEKSIAKISNNNYYNSMTDFSKDMSEEKIYELLKLFNFYEDFYILKDNIFMNIVCSTLNYINNNKKFPIIISPENGMHVMMQEKLIENSYELLKIDKFLYYTNSPFISNSFDYYIRKPNYYHIYNYNKNIKKLNNSKFVNFYVIIEHRPGYEEDSRADNYLYINKNDAIINLNKIMMKENGIQPIEHQILCIDENNNKLIYKFEDNYVPEEDKKPWEGYYEIKKVRFYL